MGKPYMGIYRHFGEKGPRERIIDVNAPFGEKGFEGAG